MDDTDLQSQFGGPALPPDLRDDPDRPLICPHAFNDGSICGAQSLAFDDYCYNHSPNTADQRRENAAAAGRASGEARRPTGADRILGDEDIAVNTTDPAQLQVLIDAIMRMELEGRFPPARSRQVVRLLALAVRNVSRIDRKEPHSVTAYDDPTTYLDALDGLSSRLTREIVKGDVADMHRDALAALAESKRQDQRRRRSALSRIRF
jgi:hypothetical protein